MGAYEVKFADSHTVSIRARRAILKRMVSRVKSHIKPLIPKGETGNLRQGLRTRVGSEGGYGAIKDVAKHAHLVEFGTQAHVTYSKIGKTLAWKGAVAVRMKDRRAQYRSKTGRLVVTAGRGANTRFARGGVPHPGAQPRPFMRAGLAASRDALAALAGDGEAILREAIGTV